LPLTKVTRPVATQSGTRYIRSLRGLFNICPVDVVSSLSFEHSRATYLHLHGLTPSDTPDLRTLIPHSSHISLPSGSILDGKAAENHPLGLSSSAITLLYHNQCLDGVSIHHARPNRPLLYPHVVSATTKGPICSLMLSPLLSKLN